MSGPGLWDCVKLQVNGIQVSRSILSAERLPTSPFSGVLIWAGGQCHLSSAAQVPPPLAAHSPSSAAPASPHLSHRHLQKKSPDALQKLPRIQHRASVREGRRQPAALLGSKYAVCPSHVPLRTAGLEVWEVGCVALQPPAPGCSAPSRPQYPGLHCLLLLTSHPQHPAVPEVQPHGPTSPLAIHSFPGSSQGPS